MEFTLNWPLPVPNRSAAKRWLSNLSDVAAMGALPVACLLTLTVPSGSELLLCQRLVKGLSQLAQQHQCPLVGGDFVQSTGPLHLSVSVLGRLPDRNCRERDPWSQQGAEPGDVILVSGKLGGSLNGRHLSFTPRVDLVLPVRQTARVKAATDISDSLALDLQAICRQSAVGAELDLDAIPVSEAAQQMASGSGRSAVEHALYDGEDFELLLVVEPAAADRLLADPKLGLIRIGRVTAGRDILVNSGGQKTPLQIDGYRH